MQRSSIVFIFIFVLAIKGYFVLFLFCALCSYDKQEKNNKQTFIESDIVIVHTAFCIWIIVIGYSAFNFVWYYKNKLYTTNIVVFLQTNNKVTYIRQKFRVGLG